MLQWEEPVRNVVAHDLLEVLEFAAEVERVLAWLCMEDGKDMAFRRWATRGLRWSEWFEWFEWFERIRDHAEGWGPGRVG